jgi:hypothetical protein
MSIMPSADVEAWERFEFLANWYGDKFGESPIVTNTALDIQGGSYDHLELLEQSYKDKKMIYDPIDETKLY